MNSSKDSQQAPSLPVDFESVAEKLQASRKRKDSSRSRRNQRYYSKKSKDGSGKNKSLPDNDEPPQPDHINSVDVSQNIRSGEVVMANKELGFCVILFNRTPVVLLCRYAHYLHKPTSS